MSFCNKKPEKKRTKSRSALYILQQTFLEDAWTKSISGVHLFPVNKNTVVPSFRVSEEKGH